MRSLLLTAAYAGIIAIATSHLVVSAATDSLPVELDMFVWDGSQLERWELRVEVDGKSVRERWIESLAALFDYHDADKDGRLNVMEAQKLPSPFALRQILWGSFVQGQLPGPSFESLDSNCDGKIEKAEAIVFYEQAGLGTVFVGSGRPPHTQALSRALLKCLDVDGNGQVDAAECLAAADRIATLDRNDDELITAGELVPQATYPNATGANLVVPPAKDVAPSANAETLPLMVLPTSEGDTFWTAPLLRQLGDNSQLTADELIRRRTSSPDRIWTVRLGQREAALPEVECECSHAAQPRQKGERIETSLGSLSFDFRAAGGQLTTKWQDKRERLVAHFTGADSGRDDFAVADTRRGPSFSELNVFTDAADRNGDAQLDQGELESWLGLYDQFARTQVLLTVLDHGQGLFELLDANHDGVLSARELRTASQRIQDSGCMKEGRLDESKVPRQLCLSVSVGIPAKSVKQSTLAGPAWFRAMDRNGDGDVSPREFTSSAEVFAKLDLDRDGLISADEAEQLGAK